MDSQKFLLNCIINYAIIHGDAEKILLVLNNKYAAPRWGGREGGNWFESLSCKGYPKYCDRRPRRRGKTTLAEAMLYLAGVTERLGRIADGNTVLDYDGEEKSAGPPFLQQLRRWNGMGLR